jgi:hypothetical protein
MKWFSASEQLSSHKIGHPRLQVVDGTKLGNRGTKLEKELLPLARL